MNTGITKSQYHMWRTLFSIAHADGVVTDEEIHFMAHVLEGIDFSEVQTLQLKDDIMNPKDPEEMFAGITVYDDRTQFFDFARELVWADGDFHSAEQKVMVALMKIHNQDMDIDNLVGTVSLQLEDTTKPQTDNTTVMTAFRRRFMRLFGAE